VKGLLSVAPQCGVAILDETVRPIAPVSTDSLDVNADDCQADRFADLLYSTVL